jgi:predicted Rossmann fold nucleotide-binding protein DprA/Smf involved in DNA uptake
MVDNFLTDDTKAIIMLCGVFGKESISKSLSQGEYSALVSSLLKFDMRPRDLLQKINLTEVANSSNLEKIRIESLLSRGVELGFAIEEWHRNGIWVISRSDADYPSILKKKLKEKAPPILFGIGDRNLLYGGGLAVVGSRNVDQNGEDFTRDVAKLCARNGFKVISGGARGVDNIAMVSAINSGGTSIGVVADSLLKKSLAKEFRFAISTKKLLLISPFNPQAGFSAGNAMARNKLIYALADYGLVVSADYNKGGTWSGAVELLNQGGETSLFVRNDTDVPKGNKKLIEKGALSWPKNIDENAIAVQLDEVLASYSYNDLSIEDFLSGEVTLTPIEQLVDTNNKTLTVYDTILPLILDQLIEPKNINELAESLSVLKSQLSIWLKKGIEDGDIIKLEKPVRYQIKNQ